MYAAKQHAGNVTMSMYESAERPKVEGTLTPLEPRGFAKYQIGTEI